MKLLLVEDSVRLQESLSRALRNSGHVLDVIGDGDRGLAAALARDYDALILDLLLPGRDGMSVLHELRARGRDTHVLILTACDALDDRVRGLRGGADDYMVKPFELDELLARVEALGRRTQGHKSPRIAIADLVIDTTAKTVVRAGEAIALTAREYRLLECLARRRGRPVPREELEQHLYDQESQVWSNAVDSAVCALRAKIDRGRARHLIHTRRGLGYSLDDGDSTPPR